MVMLDKDQIRQLRLSLGLSITEFAVKLGVTEAAARLWERGKRHPRWDSAKQLSELWEEVKGKGKLVESA
jgi:DNA-binding transcriptional regulator YiaG